ncbi:MAG: type III polyketide synthase [Acidimicrobiales bacterium]
MTRVASAATALPPHRYDQSEITAAVTRMLALAGTRRAALERFHGASGVRTRHFVLPLDRYGALGGFGEANDLFLACAVDLGERAVKEALAEVGLAPTDVDVLMTVSVTGIGAPSVDARLVPRLGLRDDVRRIPVFGLGCVAGAAGIARLHDVLRGDPDGVAVLLAAEICSLTVQRDDDSTANLVASALFGDGVAAVVLVGESRARRLGLPGPDVVATRSRLYPDTERVMGWDVGGSGFRIVLAASVADVVEAHLGDDVREFLGEHGLTVGDVRRWIAHPGGPKVLEATSRTLGLRDGELDLTWRSLESVGNLSSASVLHVLSSALDQPPPESGGAGMLFAMGPGFCSELVLLRWPEEP